MQKKYATSLFIFRRDLRLQDNTGLIAAVNQSHMVVPCFIFDPRQVGEENKYKSLNALQFMIASLQELAESFRACHGKLYLFSGLAHKIVTQLLTTLTIDAIFVNKDYTPFSIERDSALQKICTKHTIDFIQYADYLLHEPDKVIIHKKKPYLIFTPFFKQALQLPVNTPEIVNYRKANWYTKNIASSKPDTIYKKIIGNYHNARMYVQGGTNEGIALLKESAALKDYKKIHDIPSLATTRLSAHLKFGTVSIRQAYYALIATLGHNHPLIRQLFWRDFFTHTAYFFPQMFGHALQKKFQKLQWQTRTTLFEKWKTGTTGFPIVDAGMRELNTTGFMHNRVRMIVASFLVKDLHIDWRLGERYFAQQLTDYDPAVNNGNWQWCASTGFDSQPYFRIFNPWLQQKKFDPECIYIKRWVPELATFQPKIIHNWYKNYQANIYPKPIIDHTRESRVAKEYYKKAAIP